MASLNPKVEFIYTILKVEHNTTSISRENIQRIITIMHEFESGIEHNSITTHLSSKSSKSSTLPSTPQKETSRIETTQNKTNPSDLLYKYEQEIRQLKQQLKDEKETLEELRTSYIQLKRDCERLMN